MKTKIIFFLILFGLITVSISEKKTTIKIVTTKEEEENEEEITSDSTNGTSVKQEESEEQKNKRDNAQSRIEKMIEDAKKNARENTTEKYLTLEAPYQYNDDFILAPLGLGTPVNIVPVQVETNSYKSWVSSILNEKNPSFFSYNLKESKIAVEEGGWDSVVDNEGTISGNIIYDKAYIGKYKIDNFKFIEAVEFDEKFNDFQNGKLGLGNCLYADETDKEYCLIQRLKDNGSIDRRIFSLRELSDTHGELIIGDIPEGIKNKDYPLISLINEESYSNIEEDQFKMGWLTKISYILFFNENDGVKNIFNNNFHLPEGIASFDSSSDYIEAPYAYINNFEEQMFDIYYENTCRKVNRDGTFLFLCEKERYEKMIEKNKNLSMILVINGLGFEIPMESLFEKINEEDYEFFVHFKDFEQNTWNFGHPFFHRYTVIFDQDNQEIGIDGELIYSLEDETEAELKKIQPTSKWKILFWILFLIAVLVGIFLVARKLGINKRLNKGVDASLVDNESDYNFEQGQNVH